MNYSSPLQLTIFKNGIMKRILLLIFLPGIFNLIFIACDDKDGDKNPGYGSVDLYLLDKYKTMDNSCQIDEATVITKNKPLVAYSDLLLYDAGNHTFRISDAARESVQNLQHSVFGIAFAIKANGVIVYTGYFWPGYSSASCNWVIIDPLSLYSGNNLRVQLGYPGPIEGQVVPDKRNDKRILDIFASDNKLINF